MGVADFFSERLRSHLGYPPTPCQARLFDTLADFTVQYETCDLLLVSGYAGTGKTSAIAAFVRTLKELKYRYVLLAPTGRAAKVPFKDFRYSLAMPIARLTSVEL